MLREGSTRAYKRGHKTRNTAENVSNDNRNEGDGTDWEREDRFTYADAMRGTPDDPEPTVRREERPKTAVKVTAAVRRDIEGKLAFAFGMAAQTWSMVDPICSMVLLESGPEMAKKYTPLVCQSPEMVRWLSKGGSFLLWMDALMATWPLIQCVFAHHVAHTIDGMQSPNGSQPAPEYVVR